MFVRKQTLISWLHVQQGEMETPHQKQNNIMPTSI